MMHVSKIRLTLVGLGPRGAGETALAGGMARLQGFLYGGGGPLPHPGDMSPAPWLARRLEPLEPAHRGREVIWA